MTAHNQCCKCGHTWTDKPMGYAAHHTCPKCGSAYWIWVNYPKS